MARDWGGSTADVRLATPGGDRRKGHRARPEQTCREGLCSLRQEKARRQPPCSKGRVTSSLSLELEERGIGGLPHQAKQLRGPELHSLPEEGGRWARRPARRPWPEPPP